MESRRPRALRRRLTVAASVMGGLAASIVAGVFLIELPGDDLPGIALGSKTILVIERIAMLFTGWLLGLVVIARALMGELPIEVSGRGLRYADAATAQRGTFDSEAALERMGEEIAALWKAVAEGDGAESQRPRRYAVKGDGDG